MGTIALVLLVLLAGVMAWVRLAPSDPARWHTDVAAAAPAGLVPGQVAAQAGGAFLLLPGGAEVLARLDAVAMATPRTLRLAGSVQEGRITWVTRSLIWGFPDYTTAQLGPDGVVIHARLRFGESDLGVNAKRLEAWKAQMAGG